MADLHCIARIKKKTLEGGPPSTLIETLDSRHPDIVERPQLRMKWSINKEDKRYLISSEGGLNK